MSIFRFLFLAIAAAMLTIVISCSQTPGDNLTQSSSASSSPAATTVNNQTSGEAKININTAILSDLDKLEAKLGVPALSNEIQANRPYGSTDELVSKKVLTQEQFNQIQNLVTTQDVVLTGVAKDVDYMTKLGLMKGHLIVAKELLALQQPKQAEPHIGHPVEEIYVNVADQLDERHVKQFKDDLIGLQDLVKSQPKNPQIATNFKVSMQDVDTAIQALPAAERQSPQFVLQVVNGLLDAASSEYMSAIANGKVAAVIEYQDSLGFVTYANDLYQGISSTMAKAHPEAHKAIVARMAELEKTWPTVTAPPAPVNTPTQVTQLIKAIEQNSQQAIKTSNTQRSAGGSSGGCVEQAQA